MPEQNLMQAMRQSVIDGAPETARTLAETGVRTGVDPLLAIHDGFVPGMSHVGEQFERRRLFLPDMMAAAEAASRHWPPGTVHCEYFAGPKAVPPMLPG